MKTLLLLFTVVSLVICAAALCPYGCACNDDSTCEYYCDSSHCQTSIPTGNICSGHAFHPRECGSESYRDPSYLICQFKKTTVNSVHMTIYVHLATVILQQSHVDTQTHLSIGNFMF